MNETPAIPRGPHSPLTKVFILATLRNTDLLPYTQLVFKTLRVGFPTAEVHVHINGNAGGAMGKVVDSAERCGCGIERLDREFTHHEWIESLVRSHDEPFWILDTDVVFYAPVEGWQFKGPMAGALIPEFNCPFLKAVTRSRLHTSLMWIDPAAFRGEVIAYLARHPQTKYNPAANLLYPLYLPHNGQSYFWDTLAMAYHAIGGEAFTAQQKDAYFHFHFGTFSDMVLPHLPESMAAYRQTILTKPEMGLGVWREQEEWFQSRQFAVNGESVIAPINDKNAAEAVKWNVELCKGNQDAMFFCDLWYRYCHGIDDLIDTLRDGRPRMSKDEIVSLFFNAAVLYGTAFFKGNANLLFPIVLNVTNTYMDSIAWEHSSQKHLRAMADVFRTCGNEMYVMVALICGGEAHMRKMSMAIKERDWLGQHDKDGNPE